MPVPATQASPSGVVRQEFAGDLLDFGLLNEEMSANGAANQLGKDEFAFDVAKSDAGFALEESLTSACAVLAPDDKLKAECTKLRDALRRGVTPKMWSPPADFQKDVAGFRAQVEEFRK